MRWFRPDPSLYTSTSAGGGGDLALTWLGTAGFLVEGGDQTIVIDPYVSRPGVWATLAGPLVPDDAAIARWIPRADAVLVGHSHHDHVLDAPRVCQQTGARLVGSPDVAHVGRAAGLPEGQIVTTRGREDLALGGAVARGLPSRHGRVYFGRVTLPGTLDAPPPWPPRFWHLPHGHVLNWAVQLAGLRVVHIDSADFIDEELAGQRADVLCLCAIGRAYRPRYVADAVALLRPRWVVACHWDLFTTPLDQAPVLLPGVDLPGFVAEIRAAGADPVVLPFGGRFTV